MAQKFTLLSKKEQEKKDSKGEVVEQKIEIAADGTVVFEGWGYGKGVFDLKRTLIKQEKKQIDPKLAQELVNTLASYFATVQMREKTDEMPSWHLTITDDDGTSSEYYGFLGIHPRISRLDISTAIRQSVDMPGLWCFDGGLERQPVDKIKVNYERLVAVDEEQIIRKSQEIIVDRDGGSITNTQRLGDVGAATKTVIVPELVVDLLDRLSAQSLLLEKKSTDAKIVEKNQSRKYQIKITYHSGNAKLVKGSFDWDNLPTDWADFAHEVREILNTFGCGEALLPQFYKKKLLREGELIYCSVKFNSDSYKTYYYETHDQQIEVGDYVLVPAGPENEHKVVQVVKVDHYLPKDAPYPPSRIKQIIKRVE